MKRLLILLGFLLLVSTASATVTQYNFTDGTNNWSIFNGTGTINWTSPAGITSIDYLIVGGGGGGASGGGGAGGLLTGTGYNVAGGYSFNVTVGTGGTGGDGGANTVGVSTNGTNSSFDSLIAIGGGNGGRTGDLGIIYGGNGGSGGGGGAFGAAQTFGGDADYIIPRQGYDGGGNGNLKAPPYPAGGGGGASEAGASGVSSSVSGKGGNGTLSSIIGCATYYAGGGGGGIYASGTPGSGGLGGGGNGSWNAVGVAGLNGTGGGGGGTGNSYTVGGRGGSGVVVVKYSLVNPIPSFTSNVTFGLEPLAVQFNDTSITTPTAWNWSYTNVTPGNNTRVWWSTVKNATRTFGIGNWDIRLNVTNASGYATTATPYWVNVTLPSLTANFTGVPLVGTPGTVVTFTDSTTGVGISAWTYNWSFGDGVVNTTANPVHTYATNGVYDVNLTVYNSTVGYSTKLRSGYITISDSGGLSGWNRQDIMMDQVYTLTLNVKDASTLFGIPGATVLTSNGDNTTTSAFGVATISTNYTALVVQVGASGYLSRSISYVVDRDRTETIYLTAQAPTSANTNIVYIPKQIEITVMYYDPAGVVVPGAHVDLTAIGNTLQNNSQLETLYGINPTAANQLMNGTLVMNGTTGSDGGIVFTILQSINYQVQVADPKDSKVYTATLFPGLDPYTIWIGTNPIKNSTIPNAVYMNRTKLFVTQPNAGNITDNLIYQDLSGKTISVRFTVKYASNGTIAYTANAIGFGTNPVYMNYTHPNVRGMGILYGWNATKVAR